MKLLSITIIILVVHELFKLKLVKEVLKLKECVTCVDYRFDDKQPEWDYVPGEGCSGGE